MPQFIGHNKIFLGSVNNLPAGGGGNSYLFIDKVSIGNLEATLSSSVFIKGVSNAEMVKGGKTGSK